jgi:hypothetical protein
MGYVTDDQFEHGLQRLERHSAEWFSRIDKHLDKLNGSVARHERELGELSRRMKSVEKEVFSGKAFIGTRPVVTHVPGSGPAAGVLEETVAEEVAALRVGKRIGTVAGIVAGVGVGLFEIWTHVWPLVEKVIR